MTAQIYVASLADYNAGRLHGRWVDATLGVDHIRKEIDAMLKESVDPLAEEWAVHDYDGLPSSLGEYPDLEQVVAVARGIEEHGDAFRVYVEQFDSNQISVSNFEARYRGEFITQAHFAEDFLENTGGLDELPEHLQAYFDFDAYGRDCLLSGEFCRSGDFWFENG